MTPDDLQTWRKRLKLSQPEAAQALNVPIGTYRQWEHGRRRLPHFIELALKDARARQIALSGD